MVTLLVREYDEAISFFVNSLRFRLVEDKPLDGDKRWVVVSHTSGLTLLLAKAANLEQKKFVGNQTGGRVFLFLETGDFYEDYKHMQSLGVTFEESPRDEPYGTVAVFKDLYGNRWDLIQRK